MHQKFNAHRLAGVGRHVHRLVDPRLGIKTLMEDRLQYDAVAVRYIGVLPVEVDDIGGAIPVPEAQCASPSRHRELLVEGAVSVRLDISEAAEAIGCVAYESREGSAVRLQVGHHWGRVLV